MSIEEQGYKDLSGETRDIEELIPDRVFYADKLIGIQLRLEISGLVGDEDDLELMLTFANDKRWLKVNREMRLILKDRFGLPANWVGNSITITARPNWRRQYFIKILPTEQEESRPVAKPAVATAVSSPASASRPTKKVAKKL
jgi:hypothetical protein